MRPLVLFPAVLLAAGCAASRFEDKPCTSCHQSEAASWENFSSHKALYDCRFCHDPHTRNKGISDCTDCHTESSHETTTGLHAYTECSVCHDVHGSPNAVLIKPFLPTPLGSSTSPGGFSDGKEAAICFTSFTGLAPCSYVTGTGAGVCEVCHTTTTFYTASGTAGTHFTSTCRGCHPHSLGFRPQ